MTRRTLNLCSILFAFVVAGCSPAAAQVINPLQFKTVKAVCGDLNGWHEFARETELTMIWIGQTDSVPPSNAIMDSLWIDNATPPHRHFYYIRMFNDINEACMIARGEHLLLETIPPRSQKDG